MKVWIQSILKGLEWGRFPIWEPEFDFCESAYIGARESQMEVFRFQSSDIGSLPKDAMVVGSVETTVAFCLVNNIPVPKEIDHRRVADLMVHRETKDIAEVTETDFPAFIKPAEEIKRFTGQVFTRKEQLEWLAGDYSGKVHLSPLVNIISEWRGYIQDGKLLKLCNYRGDSLAWPDVQTVQNAVAHTKDQPEATFTIDFGVTVEAGTIVIEMNDGWALGNYGLEPYDYFQFLRRRWVQMNPHVWKT